MSSSFEICHLDKNSRVKFWKMVFVQNFKKMVNF